MKLLMRMRVSRFRLAARKVLLAFTYLYKKMTDKVCVDPYCRKAGVHYACGRVKRRKRAS